ncbi:TPA: tetratricopeptide repeat protein [Elizabethkingia anophelis]
MMNIIYRLKHGIAVLLFFILVSCTTSDKKFYQDFDLPFVKKQDSLLYSGDYKAFIALNRQYQKIAEQKNYNGGKALCYISMAQLSTAKGNFKGALSFLSKAQDILKSSDNNLHKAMLDYQFSYLNGNLNLTGAAIEYNKRVLNYLKNTENSELKNILLQQVYGSMGNLNQAVNTKLAFYHKARLYRKDVLTESIMANHYIMTNETDSAKVYINNALAMADKLNPVDVRRSILYCVTAMYYNSVHNDKNTEEYYKKALNISLSTKKTFGHILQFIYYYISDFYRFIGDSAQSDFYLEKYNQEVKSFNVQKTEAAPMVTQKFMTDIRNEENEVHDNHTLIIVIVSSIFLALVCLFTYKQIKSLHNRRQQVSNETIQLIKKSNDKGLENLIMLAKQNDQVFITKFKDVYPDFYPKLLQINPKLENSEFLFCAFIKLNFSSKEIANYTGVLHSSVQQRKRRLRKRLDISGDVDLYTFFNNL